MLNINASLSGTGCDVCSKEFFDWDLCVFLAVILGNNETKIDLSLQTWIPFKKNSPLLPYSMVTHLKKSKI